MKNMKNENFVASSYQLAVYDYISNGNGNAVIDAVAGSGKSTTIVSALKLIDPSKNILFLAFNKSIVEELKLKITDKNVDIRTLHSLGMSALTKNYARFTVDSGKYRQYVTNGIKYGSIKPSILLEEEENETYKTNIIKLIDLYRVNLCKNIDDLSLIAEKFDIDVLDNEFDICIQAVSWGLNELKAIDFTDMIYMPVVKNLKITQFDYVFIDECQDLSACQRELFLKAINSNGRFIAVGDPNQAIYGFAGADVDSFEYLKKLPNTVELPLSICYRCDSAIIDLAKTIVPKIEAKKDAKIGEIRQNCKLDSISDSDMVICRVNAPLVALCMKFIGSGIKAYVKGKDIGANLVNMIKKTRSRNIIDAIEKIEKDGKKIANKIMKRLDCTYEVAICEGLYTSHLDKLNAIKILAANIVTSDAVCNRIDSIFKDNERSGICLSSVHKAKGLEANNVFILMPEKFYNKKAMRIDWQAQQEANLVYVAYTRAKHMLGFIEKDELKSELLEY